MCFVCQVSASLPNAVPAPRAAAQRAAWLLRLFALSITLLGLAAQQRVLTPAIRSSASVVQVVAERTQRLETEAVRAEPALRAAAAPVFVRVPWFVGATVVRRELGIRARAAAPPAAPAFLSLSYFHSKRRIPRMNSEEPPRA
jgi:hypothetical protein